MSPCGCGPDAGGTPSLAPPGSKPGPIPSSRPGVRRIPRGGVSALVSPGAPLYPPGYTGYKPGFDIKGIGSHGLSRTSERPEPHPGRYQPSYAERGTLGRPEEPRTTRPLHLIRNPRVEWEHKNRVRPTVSHWLPIDGTPRRLPGGWPGGMSLPSRFAYTGVEPALPMDGRARARLVAFELAVRHQRFQMKRPVFLTAGPSPLEFAQAPRVNPTTPSLVRGIGPQEPRRPWSLRGRMAEQDIAPRPIVDRLAREARTWEEGLLP